MTATLRCLALFGFAAPLLAQLPFTQLVVFGDSLSDNGNFYYGSSLLGTPTPGPPQYATGEYTDGTKEVSRNKLVSTMGGGRDFVVPVAVKLVAADVYLS
jgi:phospholipase/lecithinase/hemolysin